MAGGPQFRHPIHRSHKQLRTIYTAFGADGDGEDVKPPAHFGAVDTGVVQVGEEAGPGDFLGRHGRFSGVTAGVRPSRQSA
jgi:hypothetical protein